MLAALTLLTLTWRPHFQVSTSSAGSAGAPRWSVEIEGQVVGPGQEVRLTVELPDVQRRQEFSWSEMKHPAIDRFALHLVGEPGQARPRQLTIVAERPGFSEIRVEPCPTELVPPLRLEFRP